LRENEYSPGGPLRENKRVSQTQLAQSLAGKRVLLIVGGGIAAYKSLDLVRRLRERGARVQVVLTSAAKEFVAELAFVSLSGQRVYGDLFSPTDEQEMGHIQLSRNADLVVVAPATAHLLARAAQGLADDLATTLLLATDKRVLYAPSMNVRMWLHPATQRNVSTLMGDGALFVGPDEGEMACGEFGLGRTSEPLAIVAAIEAAFQHDTRLPLRMGVTSAPGAERPLAGRHVVVTSGPTHEPIDPVRYIANRSSGKQGHAIAAAAAAAGARVTLIAGPVTLADPAGVETRHVESAQEMLSAVEAALPADIFVAAAAVADWRVETAGDKIKKTHPGETPSLRLVENPDILARVAARGEDRPTLVVGFAAETRDVVENARAKLGRKGCDLVVANDVSAGAGVFGGADNQVHVVSPQGVEDWPRLSKAQVAGRLMSLFAQKLGTQGGAS
jgi:phosphopantothenoylcysteine decarboxylase/phosphopantothenate--cysteine ligase